MGMKRRILVVRPTYVYGGAEVVVLDLLRGIDYQKNFVRLATHTDVFSAHLSTLNLPVEIVPIGARLSGGSLRVFASWVLFLIRLRPQKVILAQASFLDFPLAMVVAAFLVSVARVYLLALHPLPSALPKSSRKHWGFVSGLGLWWYRQAWPWLLKGRLTRATVAVSGGVKERLVRGYGFPDARTHVVYNGVDASVFSPATAEARSAARSAYGIPDGAMVIVSTARHSANKRLDRIISGFRALRVTHGDLWAIFTGDGPLRRELEITARSLDSDGRVKFLGHVSDVRPVLHAADVYVLSSNEEGFGIALVEAMACRLICIATRTDGPSEIIEDSVNGFLVEPSEEGVVTGLRKALALTPAERERMSARARQTAVEKFSLQSAVAKALARLGIDHAGGGSKCAEGR